MRFFLMLMTLSFTAFANDGLGPLSENNTYRMGAVERSTGGRVYKLHLSDADLSSVRISAFSESAHANKNDKAKIRFYSVKYFNGTKTIDLLNEADDVMNGSEEGLLFEIPASDNSDQDDGFNFPSGSSDSSCSSPCLEIKMEAYSVDDMYLYMLSQTASDNLCNRC